ncbi:MAG: Crp/Fnr family transcriptional regulator [Clostridia bacterium]|nr:Crp/Fnr family transcriptional regulator [Clostridia bacterium]
MYTNYLGELSKSLLFDNIQREHLADLLGCLKPTISSYKKNDYLIIADEEFKSLGIVLKGRVAVFKDNAAGRRVMISLLSKGDMFGEMLAFSKQKKWPATVEAQENCEILFLAKEKIIDECRNVCPWHKTLIENMLRIISERALMLNKRVEYLSITGMRGKISTFLLEQFKEAGTPTFTLPMNRNDLASYLNVSRPSMSREMSKMRDEGVIDFHLSSVKILNPEALRGMVE